MGASALYRPRNDQEAIRLLQQELADTNREVMALTLELETRLEELRTAEQRYRRLVEHAPDIILRYDLQPRPRLTYISQRVSDVTGYSPDEFHSDPDLIVRITHPEDRRLWDAVLYPETSVPSTFNMRWLHRNGDELSIEQHYYPVRDHGRELIAVECIARDVTDRKRLEEQFRQSQKLEAVGRLAGGIAHDFNNLLTVIIGHTSQSLDMIGAGHDLYEPIDEIQKAGMRAASLTRQLLAFSRRQILNPRIVDLNTIVSDMERMLRRLLGEDLELQTALDPSLYSVRADAGQLEQVLMNLAVNARDAMTTGGKLVIGTSNTTLEAAPGRSVAPGDYAVLSVTDSGCGMDAETRARIFEPFFTTKPAGQGTGLGLATVFGIVQQSGGEIQVLSEVGKGTTFRVYLPAVAAKPEPPVAPQVPGPAPVQGTILVVEDEDGVRGLVSSVLTRAGYNVLAARGGKEAVEICQGHCGPIDLLISDIVLPEMSGRELSALLEAHKPELRTLFMSGYAEGQGMDQDAPITRAPFIQKPFSPSGLLGKVREVL